MQSSLFRNVWTLPLPSPHCWNVQNSGLPSDSLHTESFLRPPLCGYDLRHKPESLYSGQFLSEDQYSDHVLHQSLRDQIPEWHLLRYHCKILQTGKMTYWSRSRQELWTKGMTSGHLQYVKSLSIDCDNDTILAKVSQIGAACHTGNHTCFYREMVKKEYHDANPLKVFEHVYGVIQDRKEHPKEGSYTNYLFDKGIDKILKKVGEEATEVVIAAKNPDPEEIKYELSDFLYHAMVLMVEKGVTWEDITHELANR